jgi:hypothetical protein
VTDHIGSQRAWRKKCQEGNNAFTEAMHKAGYGPEPVKELEAPEPRVKVNFVPKIQPPEPKKRYSMPQITQQVAQKYGLTSGLLRGPRRQKSIVMARFEAWWRIREECPYLSYPQIGMYFNRDHSTVIHGARKHAERIEQNGMDEGTD